MELTTDPACAGAHRKIGDVRRIDVGADDPLARVFAAIGDAISNPVLELPAPFLVEAPCAKCGSTVRLGKPTWAVVDAPSCRACPTVPQIGSVGPVVATTVTPRDRFAERSCRVLGLPPAAIFEMSDGGSGATQAYQLAGGADDLFVTRRREESNGASVECMDPEEAAIKTAQEA